MRHEVVGRRRWLSEQQFLDLLGATNLIPGPNSTEMAIHIGHVRAGGRGLVVAGVCFILPAVAIVTALAWMYVRFGALPASRALLAGIAPVIIAVIVQAVWALARTAVRSRRLAALGLIGVAATAAGVNELAVLAAGGIAGVLTHRTGPPPAAARVLTAAWLLTPVRAAAAAATASGAGMATLFGVFVKAGALLFGSGYVLVAFLRADLVERLGWLTERELLDAIAVGQLTPGPVFTTATFIGYVLAGAPGALVATVGIFLPAFVYVAVSAPLVPRLRRSPVVAAVLDGVNVVSLALMAVVSWQIARATLVDPVSIALAAASAVVLLTTKISPMWLIAIGAAIGVLRAF
jgi:chromate transporter